MPKNFRNKIWVKTFTILFIGIFLCQSPAFCLQYTKDKSLEKFLNQGTKPAEVASEVGIIVVSNAIAAALGGPAGLAISGAAQIGSQIAIAEGADPHTTMLVSAAATAALTAGVNLASAPASALSTSAQVALAAGSTALDVGWSVGMAEANWQMQKAGWNPWLSLGVTTAGSFAPAAAKFTVSKYSNYAYTDKGVWVKKADIPKTQTLPQPPSINQPQTAPPADTAMSQPAYPATGGSGTRYAYLETAPQPTASQPVPTAAEVPSAAPTLPPPTDNYPGVGGTGKFYTLPKAPYLQSVAALSAESQSPTVYNAAKGAQQASAYFAKYGTPQTSLTGQPLYEYSWGGGMLELARVHFRPGRVFEFLARGAFSEVARHSNNPNTQQLLNALGALTGAVGGNMVNNTEVIGTRWAGSPKVEELREPTKQQYIEKGLLTKTDERTKMLYVQATGTVNPYATGSDYWKFSLSSSGNNILKDSINHLIFNLASTGINLGLSNMQGSAGKAWQPEMFFLGSAGAFLGSSIVSGSLDYAFITDISGTKLAGAQPYSGLSGYLTLLKDNFASNALAGLRDASPVAMEPGSQMFRDVPATTLGVLRFYGLDNEQLLKAARIMGPSVLYRYATLPYMSSALAGQAALNFTGASFRTITNFAVPETSLGNRFYAVKQLPAQLPEIEDKKTYNVYDNYGFGYLLLRTEAKTVRAFEPKKPARELGWKEIVAGGAKALDFLGLTPAAAALDFVNSFTLTNEQAGFLLASGKAIPYLNRPWGSSLGLQDFSIPIPGLGYRGDEEDTNKLRSLLSASLNAVKGVALPVDEKSPGQYIQELQVVSTRTDRTEVNRGVLGIVAQGKNIVVGVTADHVGPDLKPGGTVMVGDEFYGVKAVKHSPEKDVMALVLYTPENKEKRIIPLAKQDPESGWYYNIETLQVESVPKLSYLKSEDGKVQWYYFPKEGLKPGHSGTPFIDNNGTVGGTVSHRFLTEKRKALKGVGLATVGSLRETLQGLSDNYARTKQEFIEKTFTQEGYQVFTLDMRPMGTLEITPNLFKNISFDTLKLTRVDTRGLPLRSEYYNTYNGNLIKANQETDYYRGLHGLNMIKHKQWQEKSALGQSPRIVSSSEAYTFFSPSHAGSVISDGVVNVNIERNEKSRIMPDSSDGLGISAVNISSYKFYQTVNLKGEKNRIAVPFGGKAFTWDGQRQEWITTLTAPFQRLGTGDINRVGERRPAELNNFFAGRPGKYEEQPIIIRFKEGGNGYLERYWFIPEGKQEKSLAEVFTQKVTGVELPVAEPMRAINLPFDKNFKEVEDERLKKAYMFELFLRTITEKEVRPPSALEIRFAPEEMKRLHEQTPELFEKMGTPRR